MTPDDASPPEWLNPTAAAAILGVSTRQAQRLCADAAVRMRREQRPYLYHAGDVAQLGEQRAQQAQRVTDATSRVVSRPDEWRARYDQERAKVESAAHTIGQLEERVRQLEAQRDARPLLEDHAALRAERDRLAAEVEHLRRPWWKKLWTT
jgi:chromosome segregation ATPase